MWGETLKMQDSQHILKRKVNIKAAKAELSGLLVPSKNKPLKTHLIMQSLGFDKLMSP